MATTKYEVSSNEWTKITIGSAGSLFVSDGARVALTQTTSLPTTTIENTPILYIIAEHEALPYFGVGASEFIYARSHGMYSEITNTPSA